MGAFFPVGTFASLTGGGGGVGATSATTGAGSDAAGTTGIAGAGVALVFAADAFVALVGSDAAAAAFATGALAGAGALTVAVFVATGGAGMGLATTFAGAGAALPGAAFADAAFEGAGAALPGAAFADAAFEGAGAALPGAAFADAAFEGAEAALPAAAFADAAFAVTFWGAILAIAGLGEGVALGLARGATALVDVLGFARGFFAPLGVVGDFMLVRDADRVGGDAGFALVTLTLERFTGAVVLAGAALVALARGLAVVFFVAVVLRAFTAVAAAFGLAFVTAPLPDPGFAATAFAEVFESIDLLGIALEPPDLAGVAELPLPFGTGLPVGLPTTFFGAGAAFFATADFADLRAGIDFDVAATMYSRYGAGGTARSPGRRADYCLKHANSRHSPREHPPST